MDNVQDTINALVVESIGCLPPKDDCFWLGLETLGQYIDGVEALEAGDAVKGICLLRLALDLPTII